MSRTPKRVRGGVKCPVCGQAREARFAPFCSRRCADHDLGRWIGGSYRIPGEPREGYGETNGGETDGDEVDGSV